MFLLGRVLLESKSSKVNEIHLKIFSLVKTKSSISLREQNYKGRAYNLYEIQSNFCMMNSDVVFYFSNTQTVLRGGKTKADHALLMGGGLIQLYRPLLTRGVGVSQVVPSGAQWIQGDPSGPKRTQGEPSGHKWTQVDTIGSEWCQVGPNGSRGSQVDPGGPKWTQVDTIGAKWCKVEPSSLSLN